MEGATMSGKLAAAAILGKGANLVANAATASPVQPLAA
jgi:hypothetical protein